MSTRRAARLTCSPARTRLYARSPPTLIADTELGTCSMAPVSVLISARTSSSVTAPADIEAIGSPSASSVSVDMPSRIVAVYALSASTR